MKAQFLANACNGGGSGLFNMFSFGYIIFITLGWGTREFDVACANWTIWEDVTITKDEHFWVHVYP